jgi:hypothetical protein
MQDNPDKETSTHEVQENIKKNYAENMNICIVSFE